MFQKRKKFCRTRFQYKKCINLLKKEDGYGQAGGITFLMKKLMNIQTTLLMSTKKSKNKNFR